MTRPFFHRERISDFDIFARHSEELLRKLGDRFRAGYAIDFQVSRAFPVGRYKEPDPPFSQDAIGRFTLDSATEFLFGTCVPGARSAMRGGKSGSSVGAAAGHRCGPRETIGSSTVFRKVDKVCPMECGIAMHNH